MSVRSLRRGAIAASRVTAPATVTVLDLPGTSTNYVATPDSAAASITGDIDLRIHCAADDWTPAESKGLISKYGGGGARSYRLHLETAGTLTLTIEASAVAARSATSSAAVGVSDGSPVWLRATWRNSDNRVQFFTSTDGSSWAQLGADGSIDQANIADRDVQLVIGSLSSVAFTANQFAGIIYYADIRAGIDGTIGAKFDPSAVVIAGTRNPTTLVSDTGETWTMNGSAWDWATV